MQKTLDRLSHIITVPASHTCKITVQCCILRAYLRWRHIYETRTGWRLENAYCVLPTWSLRIPSVSLQHCPHALDDDLHQRLFFLSRHPFTCSCTDGKGRITFTSNTQAGQRGAILDEKSCVD